MLQDSFDPFSSFSSSGFVSGATSAFPSNFTTPNSFTNDKDPFAAFGTGFTSKFVSFVFDFFIFFFYFKNQIEFSKGKKYFVVRHLQFVTLLTLVTKINTVWFIVCLLYENWFWSSYLKINFWNTLYLIYLFIKIGFGITARKSFNQKIING